MKIKKQHFIHFFLLFYLLWNTKTALSFSCGHTTTDNINGINSDI